MRPREDRYWFPPLRLGGFIAAVVMLGNCILYAALPEHVSDEGLAGRSVDYLNKKKRNLQARFEMFRRLLGFDRAESAPARRERSAAPVTPPEGLAMAAPAAEIETEVGAGVVAPTPREIVPVAVSAPPELLPEVDALPRFVWPESLRPLPRREPVLPRLLSDFESPICTPELVADVMRRVETDPWTAPGNFLLSIPEAALDGALGCLGNLGPREEVRSWAEPDETVLSRILDFRVEARRRPIFTEVVDRWVERQQRYFSKFADSELSTPSFDDGEAGVDPDRLEEVQVKILWDTVRKTYLSKYRFRPDDRIRDDAFRFYEWRGADFVVLPPLLAGYLWHRGLDRKASWGDTRFEFSIEPISKWVRDRDELVSAVTLEWSHKDFPVGLIVSAGMYDGRAEIDFVGIGTSAGMARKALAIQREEDPVRE